MSFLGPDSYRPYKRKEPSYMVDGEDRRTYRPNPLRRVFIDAKRSKSGTKTEIFTCSVNGYSLFRFNKDQTISSVVCYAPYYAYMNNNGEDYDQGNHAIRGGAPTDKNYRLKCAQYDQVRLKAMKLKITPQTLTPDTRPYKVFTLTGRNIKELEMMAMTDIDDGRMTARDIMDNPGVIETTIAPRSAWGVERYVFASNVQERTTYIETANDYEKTTATTVRIRNKQWLDLKSEFAPCIFVCMRRDDPPSALQFLTYSFTVEYIFEFRNPINKLESFLELEMKYFPSTVSRSVIKYYEDSQKDQKTPSHVAVLPSESGFDP